MYELVQVGEKTYYIECPAKIGVYLINEKEVCLIDSGNDKEAAKKVLRILEEKGWTLSMILHTHSNADHIGGNQYLQEKTNCRTYAAGVEVSFTKSPILETSFLYGGYPTKELQNKFLLAKPSRCEEITEGCLPEGVSTIHLGGHFFDMIAVRTSDNVVFLADSIYSENILNKYHISFIYDVQRFLEVLDIIGEMEADWFIPSHSEATREIRPLVSINKAKVTEIIDTLLELCAEPKCFEDILQLVFKKYGLTMNFDQYVLVGSTIRSYLSYLHNRDQISIQFDDSRLLWKTC